MTAPPPFVPRDEFNPSQYDIMMAKRILRDIPLQALPCLPEELALQILDLAAYRRRIHRRRAETKRYRANDFWEPGPTASCAALYLTTSPLPSTFRRAARITCQLRGADQGWADFGGHGTYHNSHTWFEACVLQPITADDTALEHTEEGLESLPELSRTFPTPSHAGAELRKRGWDIIEHNGRSTWKVHHNMTARAEWHDYRIDWIAGVPLEIQDPPAAGDGEGFLEALGPGCKVALWARAEQQAWVVKVGEAMVEIEFE